MVAAKKLAMKKAGKPVAKKGQKKAAQKKGPNQKEQVAQIQTVLKTVKAPSVELLSKAVELLRNQHRTEVESKILEAVQCWFEARERDLQDQTAASLAACEHLRYVEENEMAVHLQDANDALTQANEALLHAATELPKREQELKAATSELERAKNEGRALLKAVNESVERAKALESAHENLQSMRQATVEENRHKAKAWKIAVADIAKTAKAGGCDRNMTETACKVLAGGPDYSPFAQTVLESFCDFFASARQGVAESHQGAQTALDAHNAAFPGVQTASEDAGAAFKSAQEAKAQCEVASKTAKKECKTREAQQEAHKVMLADAVKNHARAAKAQEQCAAAAATFAELQRGAPATDTDVSSDTDVEIVGESNLMPNDEPMHVDEDAY